MALPPNAPVRIYTYQGPEVLDPMSARGFLTGHAETIESDPHWAASYRWMRDRMAERIPDHSGDYPVWAWLKRKTARSKHWRDRSDTVRITAEVPKCRILLSNFELWHSVLNNHLCADTEEEWDADPDPSPETLHASWLRIFDFEPRPDPASIPWLGWPDNLTVQACVDRIYENEIVTIRKLDSSPLFKYSPTTEERHDAPLRRS